LARRQLGAFSLASCLLLASLVAGRVLAANPVPIHPVTSPSPTISATATVTPSPTPTRTPTPLPPTPTVQALGTIVLNAENSTIYQFTQNCLVHPLRLVVLGDEIYALDSGRLKRLTLGLSPACQVIQPPNNDVDGVVVQEIGDIALSRDDSSLLVLDRAGNVFRYLPDGDLWSTERLAHAPEASSNQYLVSVSAFNDAFYLLDANLSRVWRHREGRAEQVSVDLDLREAVDLAVGDAFFVLAEQGYRGPVTLYRLSGTPLTPDSGFAPPSDLTRPSQLFLEQQEGGHLYVIDKDQRRLRVLDPTSGDLVREYLLGAEEAEIHAAHAGQQKLYVASGQTIYVYPREPSAATTLRPEPTATHSLSSIPPHDSRVLELLPPLVLPIEGTLLSNLSFRLPGAPRSYRYGVHEGTDFYWAAGEPVSTSTGVLSVAAGEIIRFDADYSPPGVEEVEAMLAHAAEVYHTPGDVLDVLRGRQVWIDHGDGLVSRYCHLSAVAEGLAVGDRVQQGQRIGFVGNSGTPASYYGQGLEIHLHLEIRIGEGYLGQYLRPAEVKRWLSKAFGSDT
jgi:murein DD-endopeptidase MepM/ murein hydrolase activator NlpD